MSAARESRSLRDAAAVDPLGPGRFAAAISDDFTVAGHPNGGYLQCLMANAALAAGERRGLGPRPRHGRDDELRHRSERRCGRTSHDRCDESGRSVSFVHVELVQDGALTTESLVTLGTLADDATVRYLHPRLPELAPIERVPPAHRGRGDQVHEGGRFSSGPLVRGLARRGSSDLAEVKGWLRLSEGVGEWDAWTLLFASDGLPPATFPARFLGLGADLAVDVLRAPGTGGRVVARPPVVRRRHRRRRRRALRTVRRARSTGRDLQPTRDGPIPGRANRECRPRARQRLALHPVSSHDSQ